MTLLICPVRPGDGNEELRFALRSWETNLHLDDGLELLLVGHKPSWLRPDYFEQGNRYKSVPLAVFDNVMLGSAAAVELGYSGDREMDEAVYMNDDFFCLDPVGKVMTVKRNVSVEEQRAQFPVDAGLWWPRSLDLTVSWLTSEGFPHPDSYETHRPLPAHPSAMLSALRRWVDQHPLGSTDDIPQWRTVYGVLNKVEARPVADVKLGLKATGYGSPWVSTSDQSWRRYGREITKRFQKPSRWEI